MFCWDAPVTRLLVESYASEAAHDAEFTASHKQMHLLMVVVSLNLLKPNSITLVGLKLDRAEIWPII